MHRRSRRRSHKLRVINRGTLVEVCILPQTGRLIRHTIDGNNNTLRDIICRSQTSTSWSKTSVRRLTVRLLRIVNCTLNTTSRYSYTKFAPYKVTSLSSPLEQPICEVECHSGQDRFRQVRSSVELTSSREAHRSVSRMRTNRTLRAHHINGPWSAA